MASVTIVSGAPGANATGQGTQQHIIFDGTRYWVFAFSSTQTLASYYSSDYVTWTAGATLSLANAHNSEGRNLSVQFKNISGNLVVDAFISYNIASNNRKAYYVRGTISATTLTWGTETNYGSNTASDATSGLYDGQASTFDSNNRVYVSSSNEDSVFGADFVVGRWANADSGSSWTPGTFTSTDIGSTTNECASHWMADIGSGNVIALGDNAAGTFPTWKNLNWTKWNGSSWSATANALTALGTAVPDNAWGAVARTGSDVHLVYETSTATFTHRRWNGTSWAAGSTMPTMTFKSASGVALVSDGTNVWAFAIANAAGNAVEYIKWNGTSWDAAWTTLESTSQTRNNITACMGVNSNLISVVWTETASPFNIVGEQLNLSPAVTANLGSTLMMMGVG